MRWTLIALAFLVPAPSIAQDDAFVRDPANCRAGLRYDGPERRASPIHLPIAVRDEASAGALDSGLVARLDAMLSEIAAHAPAISVAVDVPGEGAWRGVAGAEPDALFQAASIAKMVTATVVLQLVDEGRLSLDDTLHQWFPDLPNASLITIDHLLTHTSGLRIERTARLSGPYRAPEEDFDALERTTPAFCPGTNWYYSNVGYALLGRIVEAVDGRSYAAAVETRVTARLGLADARIQLPAAPELRAAPGHSAGASAPFTDYATPYAAGALAADADDLNAILRALLEGRLTSETALRARAETLYPMFGDPRALYGRGLQIYDAPSGADGPGLMIGHSGGVTGFTAVTAYVASDDLYVSVMINDDQVPAEAGLWALVRAVRAWRAEVSRD